LWRFPNHSFVLILVTSHECCCRRADRDGLAGLPIALIVDVLMNIALLALLVRVSFSGFDEFLLLGVWLA
jgi:hypothetical protein